MVSLTNAQIRLFKARAQRLKATLKVGKVGLSPQFLAMSEHVDIELILAAWGMALTHRQPHADLVFHSDRGVQYASCDYRHALENAQAIASVSRKGNCYDNAAMESFWSTLKQELIYRRNFKTRGEARQAIFNFIEVFYNRRRLHSSLDYRSPLDFETQSN